MSMSQSADDHTTLGNLSVVGVALMLREVQKQKRLALQVSEATRLALIPAAAAAATATTRPAGLTPDQVIRKWTKKFRRMSPKYFAETSEGKGWGGRAEEIMSPKMGDRLYHIIKILVNNDFMEPSTIPAAFRLGYAALLIDKLDGGRRLARHLALAGRSMEHQAASLRAMFPSAYFDGPSVAAAFDDNEGEGNEDFDEEGEHAFGMTTEQMDIIDANLSIVGTANMIKVNGMRQGQRQAVSTWMGLMRSDSPLFGATRINKEWGWCSGKGNFKFEPIGTSAAKNLRYAVKNQGARVPLHFEIGLKLSELDVLDLDGDSRIDSHMALKDKAMALQIASLRRLLPIIFPCVAPNFDIVCGEEQFLQNPITFIPLHYSRYQAEVIERKDRWNRQLDDLKQQKAELLVRRNESNATPATRVTRSAASQRQRGPSRARVESPLEENRRSQMTPHAETAAGLHRRSSMQQQHVDEGTPTSQSHQQPQHEQSRQEFGQSQQESPMNEDRDNEFAEPNDFNRFLWQVERKANCIVLGVQPEASDAEIRKVYLARALMLHPDKNADNLSAARKFAEVKNAYERLLQLPRM